MIDGDFSITPDNQVAPFGIQSHTTARDFRNGAVVEEGPRRNIAGIPVLPYADETLPGPEESLLVLAGWFRSACSARWSNRSSCNDLSSFGEQFQISGAVSGANPGFWARQDPLRSDVSAVGAIENQKRPVVHHRDQVVNGIDFHANRTIQLCFGPLKDADRCHIAVRIGSKYQDRIVGKRARHGFAMNRVYCDVIHRAQECLRSLNNA